MSAPTLAVFGGSFDPPHVAHALVAAYVLCAYEVERVLVVPTAEHALGKQLTAFEHRLAMCERAFGALCRVEVCALERELPTPSYTLRLIEALSARHPEHALRLVIGSDLLAETHAWHRFDEVRKLAPLLVVERQGHESAASHAPALPRVSSRELRARLRDGANVDGLLSPAVHAYITEHGLYA